jgi:POT family proton-dependent oligopeptide transporter
MSAGEAVADDAAPDLGTTKTFFGHPRALATLFGTEMWERFSFYGMRAILVLYLTASTDDGGAGLGVAQATAVYGLYNASVYLASLPGGWLADKVFGHRRAVLIGGLIIALGHLLTAIPAVASVFGGLIVIVIGTGLLKPNMSTMVGGLYARDDPRRDAGFSIFYMGINLGALLAPLVCGFLGQEVNWHIGFGAAGVGMLVGLAQYVYGWRFLGQIGVKAPNPITPPESKRAVRSTGAGVLVCAALFGIAVLIAGGISAGLVQNSVGVFILAIPAIWFARALTSKKWTDEERSRLKALGALFLASAVFWLIYDQGGSTLSLFAEDQTRDTFLGISFPSSFFQSVNPIFIIMLAPILATIWVRLGARQPSTPIKFSLGLILVGISFVVMVGAASAAGSEGEAAAMWLVGVYFVQTLGELCISPVGLSTTTKLAPAAIVGTAMGVWFLSVSVGDVLGGWVSGLYDTVSLEAYFGISGAAAILVGLIVVLNRKSITGLMRGIP